MRLRSFSIDLSMKDDITFKPDKLLNDYRRLNQSGQKYFIKEMMSEFIRHLVIETVETKSQSVLMEQPNFTPRMVEELKSQIYKVEKKWKNIVSNVSNDGMFQYYAEFINEEKIECIMFFCTENDLQSWPCDNWICNDPIKINEIKDISRLSLNKLLFVMDDGIWVPYEHEEELHIL